MISMYKRIPVTIACILILAIIPLIPQNEAQTTYYQNNFNSMESLSDGYWILHDAYIAAMGDSNALVVDGEATFLPGHGAYDHSGVYNPDNFTLQFDVSQNVRYDNNTQYQGPFYTGADSAGNIIASLGYYIKTINGNEVLMGGLSFAALPGGLTYSHYYFLFDHYSEWSTWRLTFMTAQTDGGYRANVTVVVNNETVTNFNTGLPNSDGSAELWVSTITNEPIYAQITQHNLLPLPMAGAPVPTYAPTAHSSSKHFTLLSNTHVEPIAANNAATSYIDNFYYGYANTVPTAAAPTLTPTAPPTSTNTTTATPTSTPTATQTQLPNTGPTQPPEKEQFPIAIVIALLAVTALIVIALLIFIKTSKN